MAIIPEETKLQYLLHSSHHMTSTHITVRVVNIQSITENIEDQVDTGIQVFNKAIATPTTINLVVVTIMVLSYLAQTQQ